MSKITLDMVYEEVKKLNERMAFLEELIEEIIVRELPKAKPSEEEIGEIKRSVEQVKKGEYVSLEELLNA